MVAINTYVPLATVTLAASSSSVTFSGIPTSNADGNFRDLRVVVNGVAASNGYAYLMRINEDTSSSYSGVVAMADGTNVFSYSGTGTAVGGWNNTDAWRFVWSLDLLDFSATNKHKSGLHRFNQVEKEVNMTAFRWANTSAINSLTFLTSSTSGAYAAGTTFSLYALHG